MKPLHPDILKTAAMLNGALDTLTQCRDDLDRAEAAVAQAVENIRSPFAAEVIARNDAEMIELDANEVVVRLARTLVRQLMVQYAPLPAESVEVQS